MKNALKKVFNLLLASSLVAGLSLSTSAAIETSADIEVKFIEPKKFRDVDLSGFNKSKSIETVKAQMQRLFNDVAEETIDKSNKLVIEVTNIDLAGRIDYFFGPDRRDIRVIKNNDFYRLEFNYRLEDKSGNVSKQGQAEIKEFLRHSPKKIRYGKYETVSYMRSDILDWMKKSL